MIRYPDFVIGTPYSDSRNITQNINARNLLSVQIYDSNEKVLCIMMNPSKADSHQSDETVNKVLNLLNNSNVGTVEIVNLYPVYKTQSHELYETLEELKDRIGIEAYQQLIEDNDELIQDKIVQADLIVFAWGDPPKNMPHTAYYDRCIKILQYSQTQHDKCFCVFDTENYTGVLTNCCNPRHPNRNNLTDLIVCNIDNCGVLQISE